VFTLLNNRDEVVAMVPTKRFTYDDKMFQTVFAAWRIGDLNPMRQYLGLPLMHVCEDCDGEHILIPHGKSLVCIACYAERDAFLNESL